MLIIYRYRVPFPNPKAHSIQIAHTIHALARAGAEVWFYPGEYTQPTPGWCIGLAAQMTSSSFARNTIGVEA
jgi:hypothetical protein